MRSSIPISSPSSSRRIQGRLRFRVISGPIEPPSTFVVDPEGNVLSDKNHFRGGPPGAQPQAQKISPSFFEKRKVEIDLGEEGKAYAISQPVKNGDDVLGYVVMLNLEKDLGKVNRWIEPGSAIGMFRLCWIQAAGRRPGTYGASR